MITTSGAKCATILSTSFSTAACCQSWPAARIAASSDCWLIVTAGVHAYSARATAVMSFLLTVADMFTPLYAVVISRAPCADPSKESTVASCSNELVISGSAAQIAGTGHYHSSLSTRYLDPPSVSQYRVRSNQRH